MRALEVLMGSSFFDALEALLFVAVCACTLFAARIGSRAENIAGAMIAYRFLLFFLLTIAPDSFGAWRQAMATMVAIDVTLSIALLVVALRRRRAVIAGLGTAVLAAAVAGAMQLAAPRDELLSAAKIAIWGLALAVLTGAAVEAMLRRRRFGYPLAPARPLRPLVLRTLRGLVDPRGRLDRRGYLAWMIGLALGAGVLLIAFTLLTVPMVVHAAFLDRSGLDKPLIAIVNIATVIVALTPVFMTWCAIALAVRRFRDVSSRPLLCTLGVLVAGAIERALDFAPFGEALGPTTLVTLAVLLVAPGRRGDSHPSAEAFAPADLALA